MVWWDRLGILRDDPFGLKERVGWVTSRGARSLPPIPSDQVLSPRILSISSYSSD